MLAEAVDTERANEARLRRFVDEVLNTGNVDAADEFIAADLVDHSLPPDVPGTLDGFKEWFSMFHAAFPDARWEIGVLLSRGNLVAREQSVRATHLGEYAGIAPTGRAVTTSEVGIVRFRDGRMEEFWGVLDEARLMHELSDGASP